MTSAAKHLCRQVRQLSSQRNQCLRHRQSARVAASPSIWRPFSSSSTTRSAESGSTEEGGATYFNQDFFKRLHRDDQAAYRSYSDAERRQMEKVDEALRDEFAPDGRTHRELQEAIRYESDALDNEYPDLRPERLPRNDGFFQMGEKEDIGPDDEFNEDDISSHAHGELEQHREIREYARLAGWEMPLLANLAKPFVPPTSATPLRFRYTTYMGEQHPAARKVVVEFCPTDLSLSGPQVSKLIKLLGPRYNPSTQIARMSAESFETQAQNKRYLGDTVQSLIKAAKDNTDMFEDVPFDFRHHKPKPKLRFPEEWLLTEERKAHLEAKRTQRLEAEQQRLLIDGVKEIEEARNIDLQKVEAPIMAEARAKLPEGKMGKKPMGQRR